MRASKILADQTARMRSIVRVFAGRTSFIVDFVLRWLIFGHVLLSTLSGDILDLQNINEETLHPYLSPIKEF